MSRLLIATDDIPDGFIVAYMATKVGYESITADSEQEALQILEQDTNFEAILVGMEMAKKGNFSSLEKLKDFYPLLPVIMIDQSPYPDWFIEAQAKGAIDYLYKPKSPEGIKKAVATASSLRRRTNNCPPNNLSAA
jgi:two-component system, NtrC family, response regulator HydG